VLTDLSQLSHVEKDALILAPWQRLDAAERRIAELESKLADPPKTPDNSSLPPSKGQKPNQAEKTRRNGPRQGSLGRKAACLGSRCDGGSQGAGLRALPGRADRCRAGAARSL
jgi:transposase